MHLIDEWYGHQVGFSSTNFDVVDIRIQEELLLSVNEIFNPQRDLHANNFALL